MLKVFYYLCVCKRFYNFFGESEDTTCYKNFTYENNQQKNKETKYSANVNIKILKRTNHVYKFTKFQIKE